ncbi:hypothetical protein MIR68_002802 [Amoeboaphelidium protococcarum]|nr:hypothetical protein MIR68_002802 [Amoeboaphelidium protococcarum]
MVALTIDILENSVAFTNTLGDRELDLRDNAISLIENLSLTKDLYDTVDFTNNDIIRLEDFPHLYKLKHLLLSNNKINYISSSIGEALPELHTLILNNNEINKVSSLSPLKLASSLKCLSLRGNPVCLQKDYRLQVLAMLPQLRYLDFEHVTDKERRDAQSFVESDAVESTAPKSGKGKRVRNSSGASEDDASDVESSRRKDRVKRIKEAIKNAKTLEEITALERELRK